LRPDNRRENRLSRSIETITFFFCHSYSPPFPPRFSDAGRGRLAIKANRRTSSPFDEPTPYVPSFFFFFPGGPCTFVTSKKKGGMHKFVALPLPFFLFLLAPRSRLLFFFPSFFSFSFLLSLNTFVGRRCIEAYRRGSFRHWLLPFLLPSSLPSLFPPCLVDLLQTELKVVNRRFGSSCPSTFRGSLPLSFLFPLVRLSSRTASRGSTCDWFW